jgi:hypothetical protein
MERKIPIKTDEFRILNRTLDNAIAGAVTAYSQGKQISIDDRTDSVERLNAFCEDLRRLVNIAIRSYAAVQIGNVGVTGATGKLVAHALDELRSLGERSLPKSAGESEGNKPASP